MAVAARVFPLVEVEDGERWRITIQPPREPVGPYLERQGRFRHLSAEQIEAIQRDVDERWAALQRRVRDAATPAPPAPPAPGGAPDLPALSGEILPQ